MGDIGEERRRIEALPVAEPNREPARPLRTPMTPQPPASPELPTPAGPRD